MNKEQELKSLKRGLKALALINAIGSITIAELGRQLGLPRTTAERVLMTLLAEGYVERDLDTKAFFLTAQVHSLSDGYTEESQLVTAARPLMLDVTRQIGWPLCLAMPMGEYMSVRVTTDPETTLNLHRRHVGSAGAMALISSGLVFLAFLEDTQREIMLDMLRRSDNPSQAAARDTKRMDYLLQKTREDGYSFGLDHGRERSLSVPIMANGRVRGALLMIFMARVLTNDAVVELHLPRLQSLARQIEVTAFGISSPDQKTDDLPSA
ncbi:helix-turn-helix domain-containing protein [Sphingobium aromaticivastans]|uniref:helix-turn-helix domain-containing protein n=1 Tax=Sphingobium aromaticivastans TaxID=1778665 RepID=UPI00301A2B62